MTGPTITLPGDQSQPQLNLVTNVKSKFLKKIMTNQIRQVDEEIEDGPEGRDALVQQQSIENSGPDQALDQSTIMNELEDQHE